MTEGKKISLLGTRGIPASHGGFETFVQYLAPFLVQNGWSVSVYCQVEGPGDINETTYLGVKLIHVPVRGIGTFSTIKFDWLSMMHALRHEGLLMSFGYPTGIFALFPYFLGRRHIINMDGIEWKRSQFGLIGRMWYYCNERIAARFSDRLIADHPQIFSHLSTRCSADKITMIPYGADLLGGFGEENILALGLTKDEYAIVIARPETDNSILEIVRTFSRCKRNIKLVVLGNYLASHPYHQEVLTVASDEVIFPGAIYEKLIVQELRKHARFYLHGHKVGGTNPSLVEALGANNAVIAHDNLFNRWVAESSALYFNDEDELHTLIDKLIHDTNEISKLRQAALKRFQEGLTWDEILDQYLDMIESENVGRRQSTKSVISYIKDKFLWKK